MDKYSIDGLTERIKFERLLDERRIVAFGCFVAHEVEDGGGDV